MEMEQYSSFPHHHDLPPGFRFHPTDEELITHYLSPKLLHPSFSPLAIADADFNSSEPWDLPRRAKMGGGRGREWYFFCLRDRKYPTGSRTNRATPCGYWKATGKDKLIFNKANNTLLIGMKKTLVFYTGRAPRGAKSNWVMHEYRSTSSSHTHTKNEWVLCRVFLKRVIAGGASPSSSSSELPPLMDASPNQAEFGESSHSHSHVTCFSDPNHPQENLIMTRHDIADSSHPVANNHSSSHNPFPSTFLGQDQQMMMMMMGNNGWGDSDGDISSLIYNTHDMIHRSPHNQQYYSPPSAGPLDDIGCLWNYST